MSLRLKRDGTVYWRCKRVGTIKKRLLGTRQGEHVWDWKPAQHVLGALCHPLVAEHLADLKDRLTREFVSAECHARSLYFQDKQ